MIIKHRKESEELRILRQLHARMSLSPKVEYYYQNLEKGFEGELMFDEWFNSISVSNDWIFVNDLTLEINNTIFQIDSVLIIEEKIYLFEVKNYEGDYFIEGNRWYTLSKKEIKNPLLQLQRNESLLRRLLQDLGFNISMEANLIFVNPEFHLYQAPMNLPIVFPTQRNRFLNKLITSTRGGKLKNRHFQLAEKLLSLHLNETPYTLIPPYPYEQIKKGICCPGCRSILSEQKAQKIVSCINCGFTESIEQAVLRSIEDFVLLFPDRNITTNAIYEWCKIVKSKRLVQETLAKHFKVIRQSKSSYYVKG